MVGLRIDGTDSCSDSAQSVCDNRGVIRRSVVAHLLYRLTCRRSRNTPVLWTRFAFFPSSPRLENHTHIERGSGVMMSSEKGVNVGV